MTENSSAALLERYQRLIEIARELASTLDLKALLNSIVQAAADLSDAEAASILLFDQVKNELFFQAATNLSEPQMSGWAIPVDSSIAGWIVTNRQPIRIDDVMQDKRHFNLGKATDLSTNSLLGVPMITKDKVIGALEAINKRGGAFNEQDQEILVTLGAQAAVAIENARLFQQSDLIAEFVHELRTPLASLNTAAHLLNQPSISPEKHQRVVNMIQQEAMRLSEMATLFLDLARLESGRTQIQFQPVLLGPMLQECSDLMYGQANERGLLFETRLPESLPIIQGDAAKLKRVILNLLSNAIKYNRPNGKISLQVRVASDEILIEVSDTGIGIPEASMQQLFTKFYRVPGSSEYAQGTGLGLTIVKRIVEGHGGTIEVASEFQQGTTFTIHLPLEG